MSIGARAEPTETAWVRWRVLPRLLRLVWELGSRDIMKVAGFSVVNGLAPLLTLVLLQRLVDSAAAMIAGQGSPVRVSLWLGALFLANLLQSIFGFWVSFIDDIQERLKARAEERLLLKASRLPLATFERPDLLDRLQRAQEGLNRRLWAILGDLLPLPASALTAASLVLYVGSAHILFPIVLLAGLAPAAIVEAYTFRQVYFRDHWNTPLRRMQSYLSDLMIDRRFAAEIRLFGLQEHILGRYRRVFFQLRDDRLRIAGQRQRASILPALLQALISIVVIVGLVILVVRRSLSVGHVAAYLLATERLAEAIGRLFFSAASLDNHLRYLQDLFVYLDIDEANEANAAIGNGQWAIGDGSSPLSPRDATIPTIRFHSIQFTYPGADQPVLDGIELTIKPGERIALVGENGAGKTTLAKLLLGLYTPTAGHITIDGVDLRDLDPIEWCKRSAAVFQDHVHYELTACENIGFGDLDLLHDLVAIRAAAERSGADAVVASLPVGYETILGRAYDGQGQDLSQGQWQKLAIARAYLRDAAVLVLDEPTAALDARAEVDVYRRFRHIAQGKSVLLISHRLGSARLADRIVVLEHGRIVEQGSHVELTARGGRYARMYATQAQWYR